MSRLGDTTSLNGITLKYANGSDSNFIQRAVQPVIFSFTTGTAGTGYVSSGCIKNMASNSRRQIERWLSTLKISGSVIDIGGLFWPVKGRTKIWDVNDYKILDIKEGRKGIKTDYVYDLNTYVPLDGLPKFDNAFCVEVTDHLWNPIGAFENIALLLKHGGMLYISSNFLFPHHTGFDCIRLTRTGLQKILERTGFKVLEITPRFAVDDALSKAMHKESKVVYHENEIGYFCVATKL